MSSGGKRESGLEKVRAIRKTQDVSPLPHVPNSPSTVGTIYVLIPYLLEVTFNSTVAGICFK